MTDIDEKPRKGEKQRKGFAVMTSEQKSEISRMGGQRAHELGKAHQWTHAEAQAAGRKGGKMSRRGHAKRSPDEVAALNARIAEQLREEAQ